MKRSPSVLEQIKFLILIGTISENDTMAVRYVTSQITKQTRHPTSVGLATCGPHGTIEKILLVIYSINLEDLTLCDWLSLDLIIE